MAMDKHYLTSLFAPQSIIVFAGNRHQPQSQTEAARALCAAIVAQKFQGSLRFLHLDDRGTLAEMAQDKADLAIVALPDAQMLPALEAAGRLQCASAMVLSHGIAAKLASDMQRIARSHGMAMLGPNCNGFQRPLLGLNAAAVGPLARSGSLGLICQSGALAAAILDWARTQNAGFSAIVALGPNSSVGLAETLDFFAADASTHSIVIYMEGIDNARSFMSALRAAARNKPVVVLKAGRKPAGMQSALTHSRAIVGNDSVFDAAIRRAGAVRVHSFVQLFSAVKCLAARYRPTGTGLAIVTNGGGPGVLAADWVNELGLTLAPLSSVGLSELQAQLPPHAELSSLIDISEAASPEHFRLALEHAMQDPGIHGVLVIYSPKPGKDPEAVAHVLAQMRKRFSRPLIACWMGDSSMQGARQILGQADIPNFRTPEAAVGAFGNITNFYHNQQLLQQIPAPLSGLQEPDVDGARLLLDSALAQRRTVLSEMESKALLAAFHIPTTPTLLARSVNEAMLIASQIGYPVALKVASEQLSHKSDVGGVVLNIPNASALREAWERISQCLREHHHAQALTQGMTVQRMVHSRHGREVCVGLVLDDPFGPVISFGAGGTMIELIRDQATELPPLNGFLARNLIERSRVAQILSEWRGAPAVKLEALEHILLRVSEMVCALPQVAEMDINPIIVDEHGATAVDARIVLHPAHWLPDHNRMAILPWPANYTQQRALRDGRLYTVRALHPNDADMLQNMVRKLSSQSRYFRYVSSLVELPAPMLARFALIDYDREMALVAVLPPTPGEEDSVEHIIGVSRYVINPDKDSCEFALVVADAYAGNGLGTRLMLNLMEIARARNLSTIEGLVLANNPGMLRLMKSLDFTIEPWQEDTSFRLVHRALQTQGGKTA